MLNLRPTLPLFKVLFPLALISIAYYFCYTRVGAFTPAQIISDIENDPQWETAPMENEHILKQTFYYMGSGDQSYAFLGEDGKTVLKLFKHLDKKGKKPLEAIFKSCKIAYEELQEETGLLYLHLNKTPTFFVKIVDKLGISHYLDINATEYALQKKADNLIFPTLLALYRKGDLEKVKTHIKNLFHLIENRSLKGIGDRDTALRRNFGYLAGKSINIDIGSFFHDETLKTPAKIHEEIKSKTTRLYRWLKKHAPDLVPFYEQELGSYTIREK